MLNLSGLRTLATNNLVNLISEKMVGKFIKQKRGSIAHVQHSDAFIEF